MRVLLSHSDCEGEIEVEHLADLAKDLDDIAGKMDDIEAFGHIDRDGGMVAVTRRFAEGCRAALAANEPLSFH